MQNLNVYTIRELLYTPAMKGNQSTLAKLLDIDRATVRKYLEDTTVSRHVVFRLSGKYTFMAKSHTHKGRK